MFSETQDYRNVRFYITNLPKDQETNTVTVYDEFKKQIISENTFTLKPVIRHRYNVQIQYTDTSGTLQTYQPPGNPIRDIDITKEGKIIITDEYGNIRKVKSHSTSSTIDQASWSVSHAASSTTAPVATRNTTIYFFDELINRMLVSP